MSRNQWEEGSNLETKGRVVMLTTNLGLRSKDLIKVLYGGSIPSVLNAMSHVACHVSYLQVLVVASLFPLLTAARSKEHGVM